MPRLIRSPTNSHPAIVELRRRLDEFYATTTTYQAFQATVPRDDLYGMLDELIDERAARDGGGPVRVLELGAGRTGYPDYLKKRGTVVAFDAQDVTASNLDYLRPRCNQVHVGDISQISAADQYDLVLSTFVFEHVSNPTEFLAHAKRLLVPGGWHVIVCPRYDLPGYLCPSLRHLGWMARLGTSLRLLGSRLAARIDGRPRFWVNVDPSVLHGPWYRDADAVHIVSRPDVERWHRDNGFEVRRLYPPYRGARGFLLHRLLTLNLACRKLDAR